MGLFGFGSAFGLVGSCVTEETETETETHDPENLGLNETLTEGGTVSGTEGDDKFTLVNGIKKLSLDTGAGDDLVQQEATREGEKAPTISNSTVDGGADNDTIELYGNNPTVNGGDGNDHIVASGASVWGSAGDGFIVANHERACVGDDHDTLHSRDPSTDPDDIEDDVFLGGGYGDDLI